MITKDQLRQILDELPDRRPRSRLDSYRELIVEMRRRGFSYREISSLLAERCGLEISHSAVHDFVKRHCLDSSEQEYVSAKARGRSSETGNTERQEALRERIAAMKRRPPTTTNEEPGFRFDPHQPLRLEDEKA